MQLLLLLLIINNQIAVKNAYHTEANNEKK